MDEKKSELWLKLDQLKEEVLYLRDEQVSLLREVMALYAPKGRIIVGSFRVGARVGLSSPNAAAFDVDCIGFPDEDGIKMYGSFPGERRVYDLIEEADLLPGEGVRLAEAIMDGLNFKPID